MDKIIETLFWSAPLEESPDFSPEDPLALDYLSQQIGLWLFPGFTSRTSRAGYYAMVIYGLSLCREAQTHYEIHERDDIFQKLFENWEKFWALAVTHYHNSNIPSEDVMRGVRGVKRAYDHMGSYLHLDFPLLSRQLELGALGAYLSSLRHFRLVERGELRLTPLGRDIANRFWFRPNENIRERSYHAYALEALNPQKTKVPEKRGNLSLKKIGEIAKLSNIQNRNDLQEMLWNILFKENRDGTTFPLSQVILAANKKNVFDAKGILGGIKTNKWSVKINSELKEKAHLAYHFGELISTLRFLFDIIFKTTSENGYVISLDQIVAKCLPNQRLMNLKRKINNIIHSPRFSKLTILPMHGEAFVPFIRKLADVQAPDIVRELITLHDRIQRERTRGRGWIQHSQDKVIVELTSYRAWKLDDKNWMNDFKIGPVRSLLKDLGKLQ